MSATDASPSRPTAVCVEKLGPTQNSRIGPTRVRQAIRFVTIETAGRHAPTGVTHRQAAIMDVEVAIHLDSADITATSQFTAHPRPVWPRTCAA